MTAKRISKSRPTKGNETVFGIARPGRTITVFRSRTANNSGDGIQKSPDQGQQKLYLETPDKQNNNGIQESHGQ